METRMESEENEGDDSKRDYEALEMYIITRLLDS